MKSGSAASTCSLLWVVSNPTVLHPAARPLRIPLGASSNTRPAQINESMSDEWIVSVVIAYMIQV